MPKFIEVKALFAEIDDALEDWGIAKSPVIESDNLTFDVMELVAFHPSGDGGTTVEFKNGTMRTILVGYDEFKHIVDESL